MGIVACAAFRRSCVTGSVAVGSQRDGQDVTGRDRAIAAYLASCADFTGNIQPEPEPSKTVNLQPGQGASLSLRWPALNLPAVQRGEVQPVVTIAPGSACTATVEIFSTASGGTQVTAPMPLPDLPGVTPQLGLVGLALGQTVRLNVVAFPPDPCLGVLQFLDSHGAPQPMPDISVALQPGQAAFLDLPAALLGLQPGQRAEVQPIVMTDPASACQATVEVYSTASGKTRAVLTPQPQPD